MNLMTDRPNQAEEYDVTNFKPREDYSEEEIEQMEQSKLKCLEALQKKKKTNSETLSRLNSCGYNFQSIDEVKDMVFSIFGDEIPTLLCELENYIHNFKQYERKGLEYKSLEDYIQELKSNELCIFDSNIIEP